MRNLKKLLAVVVAICVLATFTIPAFAATTYTYDSQASTLHDLGLYAGVATSTFNPDLGTALDRETGVVLMMRVFGLEAKAKAMSDADVTAALASFTDANKVASWAKNDIAYAIANKLVAGMTTTTVGPTGALTGQQYAALLLRELGFGDVAYADAFTTFATKSGFAGTKTDAVIKDDLVGMTFAVLKTADSTGKTVIDNLISAGVVDQAKAVAAGLVSGEVSATAAATGAKIITVTFNQAIDTTKASYVVKRDTTTLNQASVTYSDDKKVATITLTGKLIAGDYTVTVKGLTTTDIALSITGVQDEYPKSIVLNGTTAAALKDVNMLITSAKIGYKVENQYGEDITDDAATPDVNWTSTLGTKVTPDAADGYVTIEGMPTTTLIGQTFVLTGILVDYDNGRSVTVSQTVTVGNTATLDSITFGGVYNSDGDTLATDSTYGDFAVIISSAKDQYGNDMTKADLNKDLVASVSNPSVIALADADANGANAISNTNGDTGDKLGIVLKQPAGTNLDGTATIRLISKTTGKSFSFDVVVAKKSTVDSIKLLSPADVVASGETGVSIPFTAVDQNGAAVTSYDELSKDVNLTSSGGKLYWDHDYVNGVGVLKFDDTFNSANDASYVLMAFVANNGKSSQLTLNVKKAASPSYVAGVTSDVAKNLAVSASTTLEKDYVNVNDNYDRSYDLKDKLTAQTYRILVKCDSPTVTTDASKDSKVTIGGTDQILNGANVLGYAITNPDSDTSNVTITAGTTKGTTTVDLVLQYKDGATWKDVAGSTYALKVNVVDTAGIKSYSMDTIGTLYDIAGGSTKVNGADYSKDITVNGIRADGTKVALSTASYSITSDNSGIKVNPAKLNSITANGVLSKDDDDTTVTIIATVYGADGTPSILTQAVTVSVAAPKATTLALDTDYDMSAVAPGTVSGKYESAGLVSITSGAGIAINSLTKTDILNLAKAAITSKDQYGVENSGVDVSAVYIGNFSDSKDAINGWAGANATVLPQGETFNVTAVAGAQTLVFKVVIK